jgi:hypothetical protein
VELPGSDICIFCSIYRSRKKIVRKGVGGVFSKYVRIFRRLAECVSEFILRFEASIQECFLEAAELIVLRMRREAN